MKLGKKYEISCYRGFIDKESYGWIYLLPSLEYRHKYWYQWELSVNWLRWCFVVQLIKD